jgi:hypothetical protein
MKAAPRTSWTYLKGPWHSFELHIATTGVELKEYLDPGNEPNVARTSLAQFLAGDMHAQINASMSANVLPEALENAKRLKK